MFPFLIFGGLFGSFFDSIFKNNNVQTSNLLSPNSTSLLMSQSSFDFIGVFEEYKAKAYVVPGEKFYTIGYGSTRIFSSDGKNSRSVLSTDFVTKDQAKFHMRMYYNSSNSPKKGIDQIIISRGIKLNQKFYDMLCQFSYASGSFHKKAGFQSQYIGMLQKANGSNDVNMLGELLKNTWISYLKQYANYTAYGLGWSRRAFAGCQYIKGLNYDKLNAEKTIKKPY